MATRVTYTAATVDESYDGTFECQHCGLEAPATVSVKAYGRANGHGAYAAERALNSAGEDGSKLAARTLTFVACPTCGKRQPGALAHRIGVIIGALAIGLVVGVLAMLAMTGHVRPRFDDQVGVAKVCYGIGLALFIPLYWMWGRAWRGVKQRVHLDMSHAVVHSRDS